MYLLAILAVIAGVLLAANDLWPAGSVAGARVAAPQVTAAIQVEKFRTFVYASHQYMKSTPPAVTTETSVPWSTIKSLPSLPEAVRATEMPDGWRIVRSADNSWVACTEMSEESINSVQQRVARPGLVSSGGYSLQSMNGVMQKVPISVTPPFDVVPVSVAGGTATVASIGSTPRTVNYTVLGSTAEAPAAALKCTTP
ncbi:hypothetical protein FN976_10935 [Caenimonas sedimenti]|uniref:Uncharacterized protein n=1 Tax=Caenimonas sedimenti TaxID=2596921 RepID=A0A562ZT13_9BURK|nr:hypothetical protein [Caenimonas sedimenti]TWO71425.1 hypothetical protein FN976_10935 [Caenimonas sedimenti]